MKKNNFLLYAIAAYFALTFIFFFYKIDSFLKDIFIAPLFFLVPTGIGLIIFSLVDTHKKLLQTLTRLQLTLSATFLGFLIISLAYTELNNMGLLAQAFPIIYPIIILSSLIGFYRVRGILEINDTVKSFFKTTLMLLPLFFIVYYFYFIHFSSFPLRDIFMEAHFMKGALELSKYYILNIGTGDSYFALYQVHLGVLNHFYASDLINLHWILPFYIFFFQYLSYHCFFSSFIGNKSVFYGAIGLSTLFTSPLFTTNNGFLLLLSLVLFSVLVKKNKKQTKLLPVAIELLVFSVVSMIFYLNRLVPAYDQTLLPYLVLYLLFMAFIAFLDFKKLLPLSFTGLILLIAPQYHKVASLYVPLVLLIYGIYFISFQWHIINDMQFKKILPKKTLLYIIICLIVGFLLGIFILKKWLFADIYIKNLFYSIYLHLGGDGSYSPVGIRGLAAEWMRTVPPLLHLTFLFLVVVIAFISLRQGASNYFFTRSSTHFLIFCMFSATLCMIIFFIPVPHIYRILFFPALIIFAMIAFLFEFYYREYVIRRKSIVSVTMLPALILAYTVIAGFIYWLPWKNGRIGNHYIAMLSPLPEIALLVMLILLLLLVLRLRDSLVYIFTLIILIAGISLDRFMLIAKLYENSHPYAPYTSHPPRVISHYSLLELETAKWLKKYLQSPEFILISDPYTLGIFEAVTGNNGFYTFSNLGLMLKEHEDNMKAAFRGFFPSLKEDKGISNRGILKQPDYKIKNHNMLELLDSLRRSNKINSKEISYVFIKRNKSTFDMRLLKEKIIWIISEKTINWAYSEVGHYPQNRPFDKDYINNYILPYFDILKNAENKVLILIMK